MGIKDNFSQAVKELWKKDGKDGQKDTGDAQKAQQPSASELDRYLREQNYTKDGDVLNADDYNEGGIPLETPYYRSPSSNTAKSEPQQSFEQQAQQPTNQAAPEPQANFEQQAQPTNRGAQPDMARGDRDQGEQPTYNQNVRRAQGQEVQDDGYGAQGGGYNNQGGYANQGGYGAQGGGYNSQGGYGNQGGYNNQGYGNFGGQSYGGSYNGGLGGQGGGYGANPPANGAMPERNENDEMTVISKNTIIDGNVRSLANLQIDGKVQGDIETTKNIDMSGKVVGNVTGNNAGMIAASMSGNVSLKGRMRMDRDTTLIGDLSSQYADINGRIRGKLDIVGKVELKRDAIVFGDINASTISVIDGAIIQGYVNTTFLSKEDSRNVFPETISIDVNEVKS